ncbi:unnamed protein product [Coregonus sp. 'balchen']|nr:unnamed protein product [Coregonus sp. 'balchen']
MRRFLSRKGRFSLRQSKSGPRGASKDFYLGNSSVCVRSILVPDLFVLLPTTLLSLLSQTCSIRSCQDSRNRLAPRLCITGLSNQPNPDYSPDLTLPATNQNWPEEFGFTLGGAGPSYILSVIEGSSAYLAGLQPGDQVVDIEGQEVSSLSTQALVALAQTLKTVPPSIGVVSRIEQMDINPGPDGRFGFTIVGDCPLLVDDCLPNSPAGRSGLRAGDYVMEVNGIPVKHHETAAAMIKVAQGRPLRLGVLSMRRRIKRLSHSMREVEEVLGDEPDIKEQLFGVLKQYAAERNVENLAEALPDILTNEDHQQLIDSVSD